MVCSVLVCAVLDSGFVLDNGTGDDHDFSHAPRYTHHQRVGVMNAPAKVVFPDHSTGLWSIAVAAFAVGGPLGAVVGGKMADQRGRRGALLICTWTFLLGGLLQTLAPDMYTIVVSRLIIGFASGYSSVLVPIYLGEVRFGLSIVLSR